MRHDEETVKSIAEKYSDVGRIHDELMLRLFSVVSRIRDEKAKEYLLQGVGRRLGILAKHI